MLPEIGASELLVIAVVALIVVGPKDLPKLLRQLGQFTAKLRGMAAEFRSSFDEMARQSELDELRREVAAMRTAHLADYGAADHEVAQTMSEIEMGMAGGEAAPLSYEFIPDAPAEPPRPARKPRAAKPKTAKAPGAPRARKSTPGAAS